MTTNFSPLRCCLEVSRKCLIDELEQLKTEVRPGDERRRCSSWCQQDEEATETSELERRRALEKHLRDQLAEVEHALRKFEKGTYGVCDSCGQPIDLARLEALPQASLCVNCKAGQVKNAKGSKGVKNG